MLIPPKDKARRLTLVVSICGIALSSCLAVASIFVVENANDALSFIGIFVMSVSLGLASSRMSDLLSGVLMCSFAMFFWNIPLPQRGSLAAPFIVFLAIMIPLLFLGYRRNLPPRSGGVER